MPFGYSIDGGDVEVVDIASGEKVPEDVLDVLTDDGVIIWAFNSQFERVCLSRYLRVVVVVTTARNRTAEGG